MVFTQINLSDEPWEHSTERTSLLAALGALDGLVWARAIAPLVVEGIVNVDGICHDGSRFLHGDSMHLRLQTEPALIECDEHHPRKCTDFFDTLFLPTAGASRVFIAVAAFYNGFILCHGPRATQILFVAGKFLGSQHSEISDMSQSIPWGTVYVLVCFSIASMRSAVPNASITLWLFTEK